MMAISHVPRDAGWTERDKTRTEGIVVKEVSVEECFRWGDYCKSIQLIRLELSGGKRLRKPRVVIRCAYHLKNHGKPHPQSASDINDLRIEAVHMTTEKQEAGTPSDEHPLIEWEENWLTYEKPERNREKGGHMRKNHSNGCRHLWFLWSRVSCPVTHFFSCAVSFFLFC